MKSSHGKSPQMVAELRCRAEESLASNTSEKPLLGNDDMAQRLIHELEVHQLELEMQNSELCNARDSMEELLEKYTDLYDFAPVGYFTIHRDERIITVNLSGATLLGLPRAALIGQRFQRFVAPESARLFSDFIAKLFVFGEKLSCEVRLSTADNSALFVQIEAAALAAGEEYRIAVIDISERRRAEAALAVKQEELETLNSSLEVTIAQAVEKLHQRDQIMIFQDRRAVMGEMINNIAHQWRQPLNSLGMLVQQISFFHMLGELTDETVKKNVGQAMIIIKQMSQTINDFWGFFRTDKERVTFGLNKVIEQALSLVELSFKAQNIAIRHQCEGNPVVKGFPSEYVQVVMNIIMNARDALVTKKVADALISIHTYAEGKSSIVTITDNAGGIADEVMGEIFKPYFTTKGADKGSGIGLFMSRTIIEESMGGALSVRNTGNGAEFSIRV
jgi:PAS domain S-box-containing protein